MKITRTVTADLCSTTVPVDDLRQLLADIPTGTIIKFTHRSVSDQRPGHFDGETITLTWDVTGA